MSPLDSALTDSGTCITKLESTALMMCVVCVHGHSPLCLVPCLVPLSCATASTFTAAHETMPCTPAGTHEVSPAIVEHYQPPAKRARMCSNTPGHNARTCGNKAHSLPPSSHTILSLHLPSHIHCILSLPLLYLLFIPTLVTYSLLFITNALLPDYWRLPGECM